MTTKGPTKSDPGVDAISPTECRALLAFWLDEMASGRYLGPWMVELVSAGPLTEPKACLLFRLTDAMKHASRYAPNELTETLCPKRMRYRLQAEDFYFKRLAQRRFRGAERVTGVDALLVDRLLSDSGLASLAASLVEADSTW